MNKNIFIYFTLLSFSLTAACQTGSDINKTDAQGRKQGYWIKKYPHGVIEYEGEFKNDQPVGEFKRYYEDSKLKSVLFYSSDGNEVEATIYHPNGFIASKGKYVNQLKEGKWKFYSAAFEGCLINEEEYRDNIRNGPSVKYFHDGVVAERLIYVNGKKEGEWIQYHPTGSVLLKSYYSGDMLNGKFEVWFGNGKIQFSGFYKDDAREGTWLIYNEDGSLRYKMDYIAGYTEDRQMEIEYSNYLDELEKNAGKIADPEKTGEIR
jgi:antitoxin component YwqK of YwqJK toxin-antitoxin module